MLDHECLPSFLLGICVYVLGMLVWNTSPQGQETNSSRIFTNLRRSVPTHISTSFVIGTLLQCTTFMVIFSLLLDMFQLKKFRGFMANGIWETFCYSTHRRASSMWICLSDCLLAFFLLQDDIWKLNGKRFDISMHLFESTEMKYFIQWPKSRPIVTFRN